jgi:hypothetical protein
MAGKPEVTVPSIIAILIGFESQGEPQGREFGAALKAFNATNDDPFGQQLSALLPAVQIELNLLGQPFTPDHGAL